MAKLAYFVIVYKEDLEKFGMSISDLALDIHRYGAETFYILHDKDDAKPHYHFCAAFKKSPMPWENEWKQLKHGRKLLKRGFLCWMRQHCCLSPEEDAHGRLISKYSYNIAIVKDIDACIAYCTHG